MPYIFSSQSGATLSGLSINDISIVSGEGAYFYNDNPCIKLLGDTGIFNNEFTLCFINQKPNPQKAILFNCLESGDNRYNGFAFGYNDAGNLFFEYYTDLGLENHTTDFYLYNKHSIFLSKSTDNLIIGYYDYANNKLIAEGVDIKSEFWFPSTQHFIGKGTGNYIDFYSEYNTGTGLKFILNDFLAFDTSLTNSDIILINSGYAHSYQFSGTVTGEDYNYHYNGNNTGSFQLITGVTGWLISGTGVIIDDWGETSTGYIYIPLTGVISGSGYVPNTGDNYYNTTGDTYEILSLDTDFIKTFYPTEITLLRESNTGDRIEIYYDTGTLGSLYYNDKAFYNSVSSIFRTNHNPNDPIIVYGNGVAQTSGEMINLGNIYQKKYILSEDYCLIGNELEFTGFFNYYDSIRYRVNLKNLYQNKVSLSGLTISGDENFEETDQVFFNGVKLNTDDYIISGGQFVVAGTLYNGVTGNLIIVRPSGLFKYESNNLAYNYYASGFNENYSQLFLNGQYQSKGEDYIVSSLMSRFNPGNFTQKTDQILSINSNEDDFFIGGGF